MTVREIEPSDLYRRCDPEGLSFRTTDDLEPLAEIIGQPRAVEAVRFGIDIRKEGYNIFALGPSGTGKRSLVQQFLQRRAPSEPPPDDWCYVNDFEEPNKPIALRLPAGRGRRLRGDMEQLVEDVMMTLGNRFESDEYRQHVQNLQREATDEQKQALEKLQQRAREKGLALIRTPQGFVFVPLGEDGEPMRPEQAQQLPEEKRKRLEAEAEELQEEAQKIFQDAPRAQREARQQIKEFNRDVAQRALEPLIREMRQKYEDIPEVLDYLDAARKDLVENAEALLKLRTGQQGDDEQSGNSPRSLMPSMLSDPPLLRRYRVNVLVDHEGSEGAPVVYEENPTYQNLIGRIEHHAQMGTLVTDFNLIKPGALHRANGGYLILETRKVLARPLVWDALKRALQTGQVRIESLGQAVGLISTVSLEPQPVPLDVKVVLLGSPVLYYLLRELDPDFPELFKVMADFDARMDRDEKQDLYARLIATLAQKEELRPFGKAAVARVIERSSRLAGDAHKLSIHMQSVADLLREADYWAGQQDRDTVTVEDVQRAVDAQVYRADRLRQRAREEIRRGTILIDARSSEVGQVNGLSVMRLGDFWFGRPTRISARTRMGKGDVVDIEREVALGGPLHSKGVLILAGFLTGRYATTLPLSLSASLVFEQSYGGVDGDSASSAELYALLSAIADVPVRQSLAVTGSVNQHGQVQAIGAVNEKIEGFFDVCRDEGLTGDQGVLIPAANVQHLMLRPDVIEAVEQGTFHVYAVETVDEGLELLTGLDAGEADEEGNYPPESLNGRISARLVDLARQARRFAVSGQDESGS